MTKVRLQMRNEEREEGKGDRCQRRTGSSFLVSTGSVTPFAEVNGTQERLPTHCSYYSSICL
jgi:hypothetical protein